MRKECLGNFDFFRAKCQTYCKLVLYQKLNKFTHSANLCREYFILNSNFI